VGEVSKHKDWQAEHKGYLKDFVQVPSDFPRGAETFMAVNGDAHLAENLDDTFLLRLESLDWLFGHDLVANAAENFWQRFFNSQKDLRKDQLADSDERLRDEFVRLWNEQRTQARPLFATFLNDFGGDLGQLIKQDWPHLLRDRLGLVHWPSTSGKPLPVALMCYRLEEVRQARALARKKGAVASFARPTVLDAEFSGAFVPAPLSAGAVGYGHTLDLRCKDIPSQFTPELLTYPIPYLPRHIKALGFIHKDHALHDGADLLAARNRHVQGLREISGQADFAEVL
jgi:hypothetical protein